MPEHTELANAIGARLADLRAARGWTQQEVANKLGVGRLVVVHMETGRRPPNAERLIKLADLYGVTVDSILGRVVSDEQRGWSALLQVLDGENPFTAAPALQAFAAGLADRLAEHAFDLTRAVAQARVQP